MYAVFVDGSRQYRVKEGDMVKVDYRDAAEGSRIEFPRVILVKGDSGPADVGLPALEGVRVVGDVIEQTSTKHTIQHFRRRKNYRRLRGHRQPFTLVRVTHLLRAGQDAPPAKQEQPPATS